MKCLCEEQLEQLGYCFTKVLTQKFKLTHKFKAWIRYKIPLLYQTESIKPCFYSIEQRYLLFWHDQWFKLLSWGNDCVTLHFA